LQEGRTIIGIGRRAPSRNGQRGGTFATGDPPATGERIMLDPKETKKGGFGAFAQRDRERREAEALKDVSPNGAAPNTPDTPASSDATGSDAAPGARSKT
jgi:hypothetical protein